MGVGSGNFTSKNALPIVWGLMGRPGADTIVAEVTGAGLARRGVSMSRSPAVETTSPVDSGNWRRAVGAAATGAEGAAARGGAVLTLRRGGDTGLAAGVGGTRDADSSVARRRDTSVALLVSGEVFN
jgi:hypothetical protein